MAPRQLTFGAVLLMVFSSVYAVEVTASDKDATLAKIERLLEEQIERNKQLEDTVASLVDTVKVLDRKDNALELKVDDVKMFCKEEDDKIKQSVNFTTSKRSPLPPIHRRQQGASAIAFSTYLDHGLDNLGPSQTIVFNQIQLNDGNGYNQHSGAFTVPISGVYVFTFFIGQRHVNQLYVKLVVNSVEKSDAAVETVQPAHDAQGGNVVILKVNKGDVVMVEHNYWGSHLEGSTNNRLSTFSGFLLYATDSEVIVGK